MGINSISLNGKRDQPEVKQLIASLIEKYADKKLIVGRDKNDYIKGIRQKLLAFESFLDSNPEWIGKAVLIQVTLPTTERNDSCSQTQVSDLIGRINSRFGNIEYQPVVYLHQDLEFAHYLALLTVNFRLCLLCHNLPC